MTTAVTAAQDAGEKVPVADIVVGERVRKDYGDLDGLMASIAELGLLQPIGLAPGNRLLFGGRRLEAVKRLGWTEVSVHRPTTQTDALTLLKAERDENICRKDMTLEEQVDLGRRIEELEKPGAEERVRAGGDRGRATRWNGLPSQDGSPSKRSHEGETGTIAGSALDMSTSSYFRAKTVVEVARGETDDTPEVQAVAAEALAQMNKSGQPTPAYHKVRRAREDATRREAAASMQEGAANKRTPATSRSKVESHNDLLEPMRSYLAALQKVWGEVTELDESVTAVEAAQWWRDLNTPIRSLNRIRRLLSERKGA